jgi:uncharacterized membrane protein
VVRFVGVSILLAACAGENPASPVDPDLAKGGATGTPSVASTDPPAASRDTTLDVRVLGSGFDDGSRAEFALNGLVDPAKIQTNTTRFVSTGELVANITIAKDATVDLYDVIVTTRGGKKGIGAEKFFVSAAIDLGTLGGSTASTYAVNSFGAIAGASRIATETTRPFVWTPAVGMQELPVPVGAVNAQAFAINDAFVAAGFLNLGAGLVPYRWTRAGNGTWTYDALPVVPGATLHEPHGINTAGTIVGIAVVPQTDGSVGSRGVVWNVDGSVSVLPSPTAGGAFALAINGAGVMVGYTTTTPARALVWLDAQHVDYLSGCSGATESRAYAVNDDGIIVGSCRFEQRRSKRYNQAVRWRPDPGVPGRWLAPEPLTPLIDLSACGDVYCGVARGINRAGQIVGTGDGLPFLWQEGQPLQTLSGLRANGHAAAVAISSPAPGYPLIIAGGSSTNPSEFGGRAVYWSF